MSAEPRAVNMDWLGDNARAAVRSATAGENVTREKAAPVLVPGSARMLALRLIACRAALDLTFSAAVKRAGVAKAVLHRAEVGRQPISILNLVKLAHAYGVSTDALLGLKPLPDRLWRRVPRAEVSGQGAEGRGAAGR